MPNTKVLTLLLSSESEPYSMLLQDGQFPTWVGRAQSKGFAVLPYVGTVGNNLEIARKLQVVLDLEEAVNHLPLRKFRPIRKKPGRLSGTVRELMSDSEIRENSSGWIRDEIGDGLGLIGARTIRAFEYALSHFEFDYLARTNSSSFLNMELLSASLPKDPRPGVV